MPSRRFCDCRYCCHDRYWSGECPFSDTGNGTVTVRQGGNEEWIVGSFFNKKEWNQPTTLSVVGLVVVVCCGSWYSSSRLPFLLLPLPHDPARARSLPATTVLLYVNSNRTTVEDMMYQRSSEFFRRPPPQPPTHGKMSPVCMYTYRSNNLVHMNTYIWMCFTKDGFVQDLYDMIYIRV